MRPTTPQLKPLVRALYERSCVGCCLHIVLDDGNVTDGDVDFCVEVAKERGHRDCLELAQLLRHMTRTQRHKLYGYRCQY